MVIKWTYKHVIMNYIFKLMNELAYFYCHLCPYYQIFATEIEKSY